MKEKVGKAGLLVVALGIISAVLSIFNYNVRLLAWIDIWGNTMGWVIRAILVVVGAVLFFMWGRDTEEE